MLFTAKLGRAIKSLDGTTDRPIARRNARKRVLAALRSLRTALDKEYPAIVSRKEGTKRLTTETRIKRLKRAGWRQVSYGSASNFALEGIPTRRVKLADKNALVPVPVYFVPGWAVAVGLADRVELRRALKSRKHRLAALAAEALSL